MRAMIEGALFVVHTPQKKKASSRDPSCIACLMACRSIAGIAPAPAI